MLTKTSIILLLMLITFSLGEKGFKEGNIKAAENWKFLRIPSRFQANNSTFHPFILNGSPADIKDYPFKVSLRMFEEFFCGASVIGSQWALSAAHCLEYEISADLVSKTSAFSTQSENNEKKFIAGGLDNGLWRKQQQTVGRR